MTQTLAEKKQSIKDRKRKTMTQNDGFFNPPHDAIYVVNLEQGEQTTASGIIITEDQMKERGIRPRWAQVWKVGEKWKNDFQAKQWVLLEHGNWSNIMTITRANGEKMDMQIIEDKSIKRGALGIQDEMPEHLTNVKGVDPDLLS